MIDKEKFLELGVDYCDSPSKVQRRMIKKIHEQMVDIDKGINSPWYLLKGFTPNELMQVVDFINSFPDNELRILNEEKRIKQLEAQLQDITDERIQLQGTEKDLQMQIRKANAMIDFWKREQ